MNPIKFMQSRFGGHTYKLGSGKASDENLPEDQSLDNLLDNYAIKSPFTITVSILKNRLI